jgi:outer membrane lipoprotein SlyB
MSSTFHNYHSSPIKINRAAADNAGAAGGAMLGNVVGVAAGHLVGAKLGAVVGTVIFLG